MFSKPAPPGRPGALQQQPSQGGPPRNARRLAREVASEVAAVFAAALPPSLQGGSCVARTEGAAAKAAPLRTTVACARGRGPAGAARPLTIRTTVTEHRERLATVRRTWEEQAPCKTAGPSTREEGQAESAGGSGSSSSAIVAAAARARGQALSPWALAATLQLLSPWASLTAAAAGGGGVAMAMGPGIPPPPPLLPNQRGMIDMKMPQMPEEEQFAALIFPGFESNAFIWQVTCWQIAEFVLSMCLGHNKANPTPCVLYRLGASWGPAITRGAVWRLIAPVMLHANLTHLLFNVFFQLRMGFGMEKQFGREKMIAIYFACGLFGNLMSVSLDPFKLAVGASTAGFGLIGVWLAEILLSWELLGPARERTIIWIVFMLISVTTMSSMTPNMDLYGHLGGALGGFLLSIVISDMREQDRPAWYPQARAAAALGLALCLTGSLGKIMLFSPRDPLPDCPLFAQWWHQALPQAASAAAAVAGAAQH